MKPGRGDGEDVSSAQHFRSSQVCQKKQRNGAASWEGCRGQGRVVFVGEITANLYNGVNDPRGRRGLMVQREREHRQE